ncbi:phosphotransferase enzyme family protein [Acanthamoeba castellanii str. Neff]|uniref:Phosphotransferase enzyme family protein n=1 Tax=Acanthamoeba castellanii (strain ATCC 30010 / Neff) TaxID=1257118 RepID=L8H2T2_ACACF|nr:phosphotransferase enzyme family protein [Acanthamoeba castellanii str. Neff]ELR19839.1 phosphotransferase enzyme family protein [Acanthamoeba castellanii str. Neff]
MEVEDVRLGAELERLTEGATWCPVWHLQRPLSPTTATAAPPLPSSTYLKMAPAGTLAADVAVMQLLKSCDVPAPHVLHYAQGGEGQADFLLISALAGVHGATAEALSRPEALVRSFAGGLQSLHGQHSTALLRSAEDLGAKFDRRVAVRVARVERRLRVGEVPGHAERLEAILAHVAKPPPNVESDLVFTHGDYCLPNVIFQILNNQAGETEAELRVVGFVDLGSAGVADRYVDLASAVWSLRFNGLEKHVPAFLQCYTARSELSGHKITINQDKLDWYINMFTLT